MLTIVLYVLCIVGADVLAAQYMVPLPFGFQVAAGTFAIAPIFTLRDALHRRYGARLVVQLILIASILSYGLSIYTGNDALSHVTIASVVAFFVSELVDTLVYQRMVQSSWLKRVLASNVVSSAFDSVVFVTWAFGFNTSAIAGQYMVKVALSTIVAFFLAYRYTHRAAAEPKLYTGHTIGHP